MGMGNHIYELEVGRFRAVMKVSMAPSSTTPVVSL
jgi:hypothetical protein